MAISYTLTPNPIWYLPDINGKNLAGGKIFSYESLNKTVPKAIYQDENAVTAWPNPVLLNQNGTTGPLFFKLDSTVPTDLYYLEIFDAQDNLQWTIDNYPGTSASVSSATSNLTNLVSNGIFYRNCGTVTPVTTFTTLSPSLHAGLAGNAYPDITFLKNNTTAVDTISFPAFNLGSQDLSLDNTPAFYFNYTCNNVPAGETFKVIQIPLCAGVQPLSNQKITVSFYARSNTSSVPLTISWYMFYGDGGSPSTSLPVLITSTILSTTWTKYTVQTTVPDVTGKILGTCGNDATYIRIGMPIGILCNIDLIKIGCYLGLTTPIQEFISYDSIEASTMMSRTGDIMPTFHITARGGWLLMNDTSIGSASSGATNRANIDTFPLYSLLWDSVSDTYAPVSTGRGASAIADFAANKTLALTRTLGRAIASSGTPSTGGTAWVRGQFTGSETHALTSAENGPHTHPPGQTSGDYLAPDPGGTGALAAGSSVLPTDFVVTGSSGSGTPHNIIQPTTFMNIFIKL